MKIFQNEPCRSFVCYSRPVETKKYVPADQIAKQFGISTRTVYRDVKALGESGIPIGCENGDGYFIVDGYFLPPVPFNMEEAGALLLMEKATPGFADGSIHRHYNSALNKVKSVLKPFQKEKLERFSQHIRFQFPTCLVNEFEYLSTLQEAIVSQRIIEISYKNNKAEVSKRKLEPIGLIFYALAWHLIGWCHLRKDYRDFKVQRITGMKVLNLPHSPGRTICQLVNT